MAPEYRNDGDQYDPIDESTARAEHRRAEDRLRRAETGGQRTSSIVSDFVEIVSKMHEMHEENDFTRRLRETYRGAHRHA